MKSQGLVGAVAVCSTFICEKVVIRREIESGIIRITPYIVAKIVADVPIQTFFPIVFNGYADLPFKAQETFVFLARICFWMMGLHDDWARFALSCIVALMVCNAAISVGYLGSATAPNVSFDPTIVARFNSFLLFPSDRSGIDNRSNLGPACTSFRRICS